MSYDAWPSPEARRGPLPRIEDLPVAEQGYDQEAVRRAFDDFYRHAAQLDASLQALEAVEGFQRTAAALRSDLHALRTLDPSGGWGSGGWGSGGPDAWITSARAWEQERPRAELSTAAVRIAGEAAVIVAVGVIAGVTHLRAWAIVALMAAALVVVWLSEWLAGRARTRVPDSIYNPLYDASGSAEAFDEDEPGRLESGEPAPYVEAPALEASVGWSAFEHPAGDEREQEEAPPEELTMIEEPPEDTDEHAPPAADGERDPEAGAGEAPPAAEIEPDGDRAGRSEPGPEPEERRGWLRRRRRRAEDAEAEWQEQEQERGPAPPESSGHVRVFAAGEPREEPWERGFDGEEP